MRNGRENCNSPVEKDIKPEVLKRIAPFISLYEEVANEQPDTLDPDKSRAAIALAVMTHDPRNLRHLSTLWDTSQEQIRIAIRDGYYDPVVKQVGFEIFDRKKQKEVEEKKEAEKKSKKTVQSIIDQMWASIPADLLTERQKEVVGHINEGKSSQEIAQILGITPTGVSNAVRRARIRLQPFIARHGLIRIHSENDRSLYSGAQYGSFDSEKVLLSTYSTRPLIEKYLDEQRRLDPIMIVDGYIPLSDRSQIASNERSALSRRAHADQVIKRNGLLYVHKAYLEKFREKAIRKKVHEKPTPGHKRVSEYIPLPDSHEDQNYVYRKLLELIKAGEIPAVKSGNSYLVVEDDVKQAVEELMQKATQRTKRGSYRKKSQITTTRQS